MYEPPSPEDPPITTVQNISNHFSKLYLNHKAAACLTKSQSQRTQKPHYYYFNKPLKEEKKPKQKEEDKIKRAIVVSQKQENDDDDDDEMKKKLPKGYNNNNNNNNNNNIEKPIAIGMRRGRRRSFGSSSQAELTDFFACNGVKVVSADMPPYMQIHLVDLTRTTYDRLEKFTAKTLAFTLKKEFDGVYGPAWHCIVGSSFGSFVTHSVGGFMYFSMDHKIYVLLFKTAVQRAH
ncbi:uncharacterized protein LOC143573192 [Bidens hawaiensis]|uniref:uncharacterized protein LOC143573192 n=1 Tax=Bidens hawaiensis TaxID=980011 RepID=UPI00404A6C57